MSNEKKIIKEMVQGNLKVNRKRNLLLVLAITLTTILFTSVLEIGFGGIGYVFYAAVGGFILATLIGMTAVRGICSSVWLFTFQFTLLPAAIVIVLYFIIAVIASEAGIYFWEKGSITERLRNL